MQTVAQGLLVLKLTRLRHRARFCHRPAVAAGAAAGPWGGVIADRLPKRRILYATQASAAVLSLILGALVIGNWIELWMVYVTATLLGLVKVFDNPTRQTFVREMVGNEHWRTPYR